MQKLLLGKTGLEVSELCFGALPMGPLQANLSVAEGAMLLRAALEQGVNFIDTAEGYRTYPHIKKALAGYSGEVIITTKSHAENYEDMEKSIEEALQGMGRTYLDIVLLHAARATASVFAERAGALQCLQDYKKRGIIRAIGISAHAIEVVNMAAGIEELDVVFPIINLTGMGIIGGSSGDMIKAINRADQAGKGLYAMKVLAGGHLIHQLPAAVNFVRKITGISSIALGMVRPEELAINLKLFKGEVLTGEDLKKLETKAGKRLVASRFCIGCGNCVTACPNGALAIVDGKAAVDNQMCILCGYCHPACPEFALRLI